jgi:hypothetical protein
MGGHAGLSTLVADDQTVRLAVTRLYEPPQMPYTEANDDFRQKIPKFILIESAPL